MSFGQCRLPATAVVVGCGPQWVRVCPLGLQHPDPTARFPFLPSLRCRFSSEHQHPGDPCHGETRTTVPKPNVKIKTNKKVRKAAEGCPSMPELVGLCGVVAAVTQQGAGSQVKGEGPSQGPSYCRVAGIRRGKVSSILNAKGWRPAFSYPWGRL